MNLFTKIKKVFSKLIGWFLKLSLKKKIIIVVILTIAIWFGSSRFLSNNQTPQYRSAKVERGEIISALSESGNVSAGSQVNITSPTDGVIEEVYVKNGDEVSPGQNLFKVRSIATPEQKAQAYSSYLSSQNSLNSAQAKINSLQATLFKANQTFMNDAVANNLAKDDPKYIEENADWLQAEADYKNQEGVIKQAQAALNSAALSYQATEDSVVTAPVAGIVANFSAGIGNNVSTSVNTNSTGSTSSSSSNTASSAVMVIGNFSNLSLKTQVSEVDIPKIKIGQKVTITLDALPDKTFVGEVVSADTIGINSSGVVTYNVVINFIAPSSEIHPGMSGSASIQIDRKDNVLSVPSSAVQTLNGESYVRVLKNGNITQVPVETGISSDTNTEIASGLSEGDTIVTSIINQTTSSQGSSPFSGLGGRGGGFFGGGNSNRGAVMYRRN